MVLDARTKQLIEQKAKSGVGLSAPSAEKTAYYNSLKQQPKPAYSNPKPYTNAVQKPDWSNEINRTNTVIQQRQAQGLDNTRQYQHYKNMTGRNYSAPAPRPQMPKSTYQKPVVQNQGLSAVKSNPLLSRDLGIGNKTNLGFNDWSNYDAVMEQLNASATALGTLNRDNSLNMSDVSDIYEHYLKSAARAQELGFDGAVSPGIVTGFAKASDDRWKGFRTAEERGFDPYTSVNSQWEKYLQNPNQASYSPAVEPYEQPYAPQQQRLQQMYDQNNAQRLKELMAAYGLYRG